MAAKQGIVEYIPAAPASGSATYRGTKGSTANDVKIVKLLLKAEQKRADTLLIRQLIASPLVQMIGTVFAAELAEEAGLITDTWSGAIEGGMLAMVGLQAIKDYGLIPGGAVASAMGLGALANTSGELPGGYGTWDAVKDWLKGSLGLTFL